MARHPPRRWDVGDEIIDRDIADHPFSTAQGHQEIPARRSIQVLTLGKGGGDRRLIQEKYSRSHSPACGDRRARVYSSCLPQGKIFPIVEAVSCPIGVGPIWQTITCRAGSTNLHAYPIVAQAAPDRFVGRIQTTSLNHGNRPYGWWYREARKASARVRTSPVRRQPDGAHRGLAFRSSLPTVHPHCPHQKQGMRNQ